MSKSFDIGVDDKEESLSHSDHLEAVLFQFVNLYERWSEDRQIAAKQSADLSKFVKEFAQQVNKFAALEEKVRDDIHTSMRREAENMAVYLGGTIGEAARKQIAPTIKKLEETSDEAKGNLISYYSELSRYKWVTIGAAVFASITTSLLIVWCLIPKPTLPFTDEQIKVYEVGKSFSELWPTLSKEKKKWFLNVTKEK